jgi:hypothetical protein
MLHDNQGALTSSFPRKRESRSGEFLLLTLDPRFRGGDDLLLLTNWKGRQ